MYWPVWECFYQTLLWPVFSIPCEVANYWLNRFDSEKYSAQAELIELVMAGKLVLCRNLIRYSEV